MYAIRRSNYPTRSKESDILFLSSLRSPFSSNIHQALGKNMQQSRSHSDSAAESLLNNKDIMSTYRVLSPRVRVSLISSTSQQLIAPTVSPAVARSHPSLMVEFVLIRGPLLLLGLYFMLDPLSNI